MAPPSDPPIVPVPDPGPAPIKPTFPLTEAYAAQSDLATLLAALSGYDYLRSTLVSTVLTVAAGSVMDSFRERNTDLARTLSASYQYTDTSLGGDKDWIDLAISNAELALDQWELDHAAWQTAHADYANYLRQGGVPFE